MVDMSRKQKKERSTYATVGAEAGVSVKSAFGSDGSALTKGEVQPSEYRYAYSFKIVNRTFYL